ncbi:MAG: Isoleucyl-tRNA synthetase [Candidatus Methanohalarchaeum thermophilum]|uniref:Isoleucine--tRNA ligase n=1 Tax=Methanohalarchaeum thermophilum TaxID=1903181 RepID=A0A1Q6DW43_METT1|nr:MAG: Isoleucyl-tRNA synthetase [Candidatus Methanohalarchaeum thermophilum]
MIEKVAEDYNPEEIEAKVRDFWESNDIRKKSRKDRDGDNFYFVDGPPYTTGKIHLGTTWNKIIKDSVLRYRTLKGDQVSDTPGWDMHGLPIEVKVEKKFDFEDKREIEEFGLENFVDECKNFARDFKDQMTEQFKEFGSWFNWKDPYMTMTDDYIESVWWTLKRSEERDLLERGVRVNNWCPRCETAIADSEVEYDEISDPSIYVKFPIQGKEDTYLVIWTTTPWTIPSNLAVGVHPDHEYSILSAKKNGETEKLILSSDLYQKVLEETDYSKFEVEETKKGRELEGMGYLHPLREEIPKQRDLEDDKVHKVYAEDFVSVEKTGLVHMAPSHGEEDYKVGKKRNLPLIKLVNESGRYIDGSGKYESSYVRDANQDIINDLDKNGLLLKSDEITHRYGFCWRCDTPIIYLATRQWFINVTELKEEMVEEVDSVDWKPSWAGESRFKDWVSNAKDWCISRQRFWGTPLPVWICKECGKREVLGSKKELESKAIEAPDELELHRPYVDKVKLNCECGGQKERVKDVMDVWMDSACASWATLNFPREKTEFEELWPADFITEGHDQTRGWFYSQLGAGTIAFDQIPYKSVLMHGFVLDEDGRKMSKSVGNVVQPGEIIDRFGSDTMRLYLLSACAPWEDLKFSWNECENVRRTLNVFWNVYKFACTYMSIDDFIPEKEPQNNIDKLKIEDKWILSRLQSLKQDITDYLDNYQIHDATRKISDFILEDLSRWYVRLIRDRTWIESHDQSKLTAYETLYEVLKETIILISPFTPFLSEEMYSNLVKGFEDSLESVHMEKFPSYKSNLHNPELEEDMDLTRKIVESASHARQKEEMKLRWPVKEITVSFEQEDKKERIKKLNRILKDQINTKKINLLGPKEEFNELVPKPSPKMEKIGPKFKSNAEKIMQKIKETDGTKLKGNLPHEIEVEGKKYTITDELVEFKKTTPEYISESNFNGGKVYVNIKIDKEIQLEGYAREITRRIQQMRKELNLNIEEDINVFIETNDQKLKNAIREWNNYISHETRAKNLKLNEAKGNLVKEWEIEDKNIEIGLNKLNGD